MKRKIKAMLSILFSKGYILCTIKQITPDKNVPNYDHNVSEDAVLHYMGFICKMYEGNKNALKQSKDLLM